MTGCSAGGSIGPMSGAAAGWSRRNGTRRSTRRRPAWGCPAERIAAIAGDLCDAESMFALKELLRGLGATSLDCRQDGAKLDPRVAPATCSTRRSPASKQADACLLIGTNPRWEAPIINARLRKRYLQGGFKVAAIGQRLDLTFPVEMLGEGGETLSALAAASTIGPSVCATPRRRC